VVGGVGACALRFSFFFFFFEIRHFVIAFIVKGQGRKIGVLKNIL